MAIQLCWTISVAHALSRPTIVAVFSVLLLDTSVWFSGYVWFEMEARFFSIVL